MAYLLRYLDGGDSFAILGYIYSFSEDLLLSNALGYSTFRCNPNLGVLQIGTRAKVIENQQSCLLHRLRLPTLPSTPTLSQAESSGEPMRRYLMEPHDPDYVPERIYPEYIPLEDEHEFLAEEHPLPPVVSPTAESPGYVVESDPEEDPEEYEDDETEDGPVDYPMDEGEDEDDKDEEEDQEHLALPTPLIIVRLQASISLPPKTEVERLLAMPTPPPSPPISLSPPFAGERLARIASTQALVDAVTSALPSPPLPPLPPCLYIPPPIDRRDDIPESERPPRKRSCLFALGSRYEVGESSTARPTRGRG
ncbi:hypothetical protein Tco_1177403, partial [Tanacetum coccineum]